MYKIFGTRPMSKDSYKICKYFSIHPVEQLLTSRQNRFINRYRETDKFMCQLLC